MKTSNKNCKIVTNTNIQRFKTLKFQICNHLLFLSEHMEKRNSRTQEIAFPNLKFLFYFFILFLTGRYTAFPYAGLLAECPQKSVLCQNWARKGVGRESGSEIQSLSSCEWPGLNHFSSLPWPEAGISSSRKLNPDNLKRKVAILCTALHIHFFK